MMENETPITVTEFRNLIESKDFIQLRQKMQHLDTADIAEIISDLESSREFVIAFRLIKRHNRHIVFTALPREIQETLLNTFSDIVVSSFINAMNPDDRTRLLEDLPADIAEFVITKLNIEEQQIARKLLSYPPESVGRVMTTDFVEIKDNIDVATALSQVRWLAAGLDKSILTNIWVVSAKNRKYLGSITLAEIVTMNPTTTLVADMMQSDHAVLHTTDDQEIAVDLFRKYDRDILAVVDDTETLQGIVTADDVFTVAEEEATEDMQQFGGQATLDNLYFSTPIFTLMRKRAGWLAVLFFGEVLTGTALKHYDHLIVKMGFLIYFIPLVISTGGNSGTQAAALIIRGLAVREMLFKDWFRVFRREIVIGLTLGLFLGTMGYLRALTWGYGWQVGTAVLATITSVVVFGALLGAMLPFLFKKMKLDPAVVSSPFIASLVDLFGVVALLLIARAIIL